MFTLESLFGQSVFRQLPRWCRTIVFHKRHVRRDARADKHRSYTNSHVSRIVNHLLPPSDTPRIPQLTCCDRRSRDRCSSLILDTPRPGTLSNSWGHDSRSPDRYTFNLVFWRCQDFYRKMIDFNRGMFRSCCPCSEAEMQNSFDRMVPGRLKSSSSLDFERTGNGVERLFWSIKKFQSRGVEFLFERSKQVSLLDRRA